MEMKEKKAAGLSSGFLLGVVVGVIITLLLTTKRGKKMLKMITEEGMNKISNWEELLNDAVDDYSTKPHEPTLPSVELVEEAQDDESNSLEMESEKEEKEISLKKEPKPLKRFFKGVHRSSIN